MKSSFAFAAALAVTTPVSLLQAADPGLPADNGLVPVTDTFYVNPVGTINNGNTESLGVGLASNGNVLIGWEDDGDELTDLAGVWTLYRPNGEPLTEYTSITTIDPAYEGHSLFSNFLSYFRSDDSAVPGRTSWGPKIKANLFGDGLGMGATSFDLGIEVVEFHDTQFDSSGENAGDFPSVQLLNNNGAAEGLQIVSGVPADYARRPGNIRVGDWDFLQTGNIVIVGESRQQDDLEQIFGGDAPANHAIVRIVDPSGAEVKAVQLVSDVPEKAEIWHGVGVTANGFGVRFANAAGRATVRLFDNAGTPVSTNIDLALVAGSEVMAAGGRGDSVGFHGNGRDAYAAVARALNPETAKMEIWVTVLNADGSLRWAKSVSDDVELTTPSDTRCDVGIDAAGRVVVVYDDALDSDPATRLILGRLFGPSGTPLGGTFYVSEREAPGSEGMVATKPRVAFRSDSVAVVWESTFGDPVDLLPTVAARFFGLAAEPGTIESVGLTRIVPDTVVINQNMDSLGNWEPYASVLGTSTFLIEGNAFAAETSDQQRYVVALQPAAGGAARLAEAFYADNGSPFTGPINASRQDGNPGRVAGDVRPGAVNFITGGEASPHLYDPFQSDNRWTLGYDRLDNGRYATIQIYQLDPATLEPTSLTKAIDSANGRLTTGAAPDAQITRFGGDLVGLDNGNFVSLVEDRSRERDPANASVATIFAPDGTVVKESFVVATGDQWSNLAAVKGGFVVRAQGVFYFYDNEGNLQGSVPQNTSGVSFDAGRGDGTRIGGHINSPYVFLAGKVADAPIVRVAAWDARTRAFVAVADVSEGGFRGDFDRAVVTADALGRVVVAWVSRPDGYEAQQVAARVLALDETAKTITPLTASFLPFINAAPTGGIRSFQMSVAMTTKQILVAAKGEINLENQPDQGANSPSLINFYTVFTHPDPQDDPTPPVSGDGITVTATASGDNLVVTWTGGTGPFTVRQRASLNSGNWTDVTTTSERTANVPLTGNTGFVQVVGQ